MRNKFESVCDRENNSELLKEISELLVTINSYLYTIIVGFCC